MKYAILLYILTLFMGSAGAQAQTTIAGTVVDAKSRGGLPFVNVGIAGGNTGTTTRADGGFILAIPTGHMGDTLTFSMAGYAALCVPVRQITAAGQTTFALQSKTAALTTVTVSARKLAEKNYGMSGGHSLLHFTDGSTNQHDIFEIAQVVPRDTTVAKITAVSLYIKEGRADSGTFRINFYSYVANRPGARLVEQNILQTCAIKEGWLRFDLKRYNIRLKGPFVAAIEFMPAGRGATQLYYEIKPGGSGHSFVRSSSQGIWSVPPHRYRMYVTVLEPDTKGKRGAKETAGDEDTKPALRLYSRDVKDSFSIFVHLPADYSRKRHRNYPVVYLLDANVYFDAVSNAIDNQALHSAIVVGIGYRDFMQMDSLRSRDYTFPQALRQDSFAVSGGAALFSAFINTALVPVIDRTYRTDTNRRTLMGHSLGGYFTLYALLRSLQCGRTVFDKYVAASPSLDYDSSWLVKQFEQIPSTNGTHAKVCLTIGGREDREDSTGTLYIDAFHKFHSILTALGMPEGSITTRVYAEYGHMETAIPTFIKSLEEGD